MSRSGETLPSAPRADMFAYERSNELLEECLNVVLQSDDEEEGLCQLLAYLGRELKADRVYVFRSLDSDFLCNTQEWCAEGVTPQKGFFQKLKVADIQSAYELFLQKKSIVIEDIETIRFRNPVAYAQLKPQNIHKLVAGRICQDEKIVGFVGLDNPGEDIKTVVEPVIIQIGRIVSSQLMRIDMAGKIRELGLRDLETGLYNRNALYHHYTYDQSASTMGLILGRVEEDASPASAEPLGIPCDRLRDLLGTGRIYRIAPNEFAAVYVNISEKRMNELRNKVKFSRECIENRIKIGSSWKDKEISLDRLLQDARRWSYLCGDANQGDIQGVDALCRYLEKNSFDLGFFLHALVFENENGYFFFGDMPNNTYYVSDNLERKFALSGNIIQNFPKFWLSRINGKAAQARFENECRTLLAQKRECLDVYQQVTTSEGHLVWVRFFALVKWNWDKTVPRFCAGRLVIQDVSLMVDSVTNFNWETVLIRNLSQLREEGRQVRVIGFSFNDIAKVNKMQGRAFGDNLIRSVAGALLSKLSDRLAFYKLSGMRYAALIREDYREQYKDLILQIRGIIDEKYSIFGIKVPNACSFAVLDFPRENVGTLDFVEDLVNCVKLSQRDISVSFVDGRNLDIRKLQESSDMALALGRDVFNQMHNFRLVIQPMVSTNTGEVVAGESLLRWQHDGKNVPPEQFVPVLEHEKLIGWVGRWVFEQSVQICRRIISFQPEFHLCVNVSLQQMDDPGFLEFISETLHKYNLDGSHILLEITESCMDKEQEKLMHFVNYCSALGVKVALDDFGTGYSSIRVLMQYPTSLIKLDKSLLMEMGKSADKFNFISSIVFSCHQFGKKVCIEGVETREQCEMAKRAKCDMIQGFYYFRSMEVDDIYRMLAKKGTLTAEIY